MSIVDGRIDITLGNDVNQSLNGSTLTLTPYVTNNTNVMWSCGLAAAPAGGLPMGTGSGGDVTVYSAGDLPSQYLPSACRP